MTDFNILKGDITVLTNTGVLIDISIEKMIYTGSNEIYHLDISGDTQIYMNTNRAFMRSGLFSFIPSILPSIKNNIIEHYLSIVNSKYTPNETINKKDEENYEKLQESHRHAFVTRNDPIHGSLRYKRHTATRESH